MDKDNQIYVDIKEKDKRLEFIYFLEGMNFKPYHFKREHTINSVFPFEIDLSNRTYSHSGTDCKAISKENAIKIITEKCSN